LSYTLSLNGQAANKNLNSSERFSLGGANGVRVYPRGEVSGDQGFLVSAELHWALPGYGWQLATFFDAGRVIISKDPNMTNEKRLYFGRDVSLFLELSGSRRDVTRGVRLLPGQPDWGDGDRRDG
jgi:outer membrane protein assembly factor BamA